MKSFELRKTAAHLLHRIFYKNAYMNLVQNTVYDDEVLSDQEKQYLRFTLREVVCWKRKYEHIIDFLSKRPFAKIERSLQLYLLIGINDLQNSDTRPEYASVNEVVQAVRKIKGQRAAGFVNGLLREYIRSSREIVYPDKTTNPVESLAVANSFPDWIVERWLSRYSFEQVEKLCRQSNSPAKTTTIRVNSLLKDNNKFIEYCRNEGLFETRWKEFPGFYSVKDAGSLFRSWWFQQGYFTVQSLASGLSPLALDIKKGSLVVDYCAAPGGKLTFLGERLENKGQLIASDINLARIGLVRNAARTMHIENAHFLCADATTLNFKEIDYALLDVPCSGFGVIHKKPDIKWSRKESDIIELKHLQKSILSNAATSIKVGGALVYSTCTIEPEENENVIYEFLNENRRFCLEPLPSLPYLKNVENETMVTTSPLNSQLDGSFIAKIRRIS